MLFHYFTLLVSLHTLNSMITKSFDVWAPHANSVSVQPVGVAKDHWNETIMVRNDDNWHATVTGVQPGDGYLFRINNQNKIDPVCQDISLDNSHSIISGPYTFRNPRVVIPKEKAIYYEMLVSVFTKEGTFDAAIKQLDYLFDLGINVIELMPVMHYCGKFKGWGYCPMAPFAVRPELGGSTGLKRFVDSAADRGMAVALDIVWNHAAGNTLLKDYDGWTGGSNGIYFYNNSIAQTPWGPRPDYGSSMVQQYIVDSITMLIDEFHIGSFRWDSTACIRKGDSSGHCSADIADGWRVMQRANNASQNGSRAGTVNVAEDNWGKPFPAITMNVNDTSAKGPIGTTGGAGFQMEWGYSWYFSVVNEVTKVNNSEIDLNKIVQACTMDLSKSVIFTENHDISSNQEHSGVMGRIPQRVDPDGKYLYWAQKKAMLLIGMVLTCPGTPMLLQGQELLTFESFDFPTPPTLNWSLVTVNKGMLQESKDMIALRRNQQKWTRGLVGGNAKIINITNTAYVKVVILHRWSDGSGASNDVLVIYNLRNTKYTSYHIAGVPYDGTWHIRFNGDNSTYSTLYTNSCTSSSEVIVKASITKICIPPMSMLILSRA